MMKCDLQTRLKSPPCCGCKSNIVMRYLTILWLHNREGHSYTIRDFLGESADVIILLIYCVLYITHEGRPWFTTAGSDFVFRDNTWSETKQLQAETSS